MSEDRPMSTAQLAEFLDVPVKTIYHWRMNGVGPRAVRVGRELRFRRKDVDDWLEEHADPRSAA